VRLRLDNTAKRRQHMRGLGIILTLVIAAIVGVGAYQLGLAQGLSGTGSAVAPTVYYHPFFFGGFLFPLLFLFLIFALVGSAFSRRRGWSNGGGWGGHGYYQSARERLEELHRELHGEKPKDTGTSSSPPPSGR
jgi:hypothetical protein